MTVHNEAMRLPLFIGVWTAAHHRTCRTTASRSPLLTLGGICVPPTVNYLQCLVTGSTLTAIGQFQLPAPQYGTFFRILSGTRPSVQTVLDVYLKRMCSLDTSALSALRVLDDNCAIYKCTYLLTYLPLLSDHRRIDETSVPFVTSLQFPRRTFWFTPTTPIFVFTPPRNAVAVPDESGTWKSTL